MNGKQKTKGIFFVLFIVFVHGARCVHHGSDLIFDKTRGSSEVPASTGGSTGSSVTITGVNASNADGIFITGNTLNIQVIFSAIVTTTGTPQLVLRTSSGATTALNYTSGSGSNTLVFTYTVANGDNSADLDYDSAAALSGTIRDSGNLNVGLSLPSPGASGSLGANKNLIVDTGAPSVQNVTASNADGSYPAGSVLTIQIVFSEAVTVTGTPRLRLVTNSTGPIFTFVNYTSGSGTNTLGFDYTVGGTDNSSDLEYQNASSLTPSGGGISDAAGNNASLTLPAPGSAGSLGTNKNLAVP